MMDIEKYLKDPKHRKAKPFRFAESTMKPLSNDEVYDQALINGAIGMEPSMVYLMETDKGNNPTLLSQYHGVSSSGMQAINP